MKANNVPMFVRSYVSAASPISDQTATKTPVMIVATDVKSLSETARREPVAGDAREMYRRTAAGEGLMVSDNLAQLKRLALGEVVDDAIIVSEFAERRMSEGMPPKEAYSLAAKRMAGPVIAATATRVAAFSPLLFWPGIVGQFMKYLPITLVATLSASLVVALVFMPTGLLGRADVEKV